MTLPIKSKPPSLMSRATPGFVLELAAKEKGAIVKRKRLAHSPVCEDSFWQQHRINHMDDTV